MEGRERALPRGLRIPASTRRSWLRRGAPEVVALEEPRVDSEQLERLSRVERQVARLRAMVRLLIALVRATGARLDRQRLPDGDAKADLLAAIARSESVLERGLALRIVGLTEDRLRAWKRRELACRLDDAPPCPRRVPGRLTREERSEIRTLVEDPRYGHFSIRGLALLAQRTSRVFASYVTWCSLIREHGWRRPRLRVHPESPTVGLRTTAPNEWWHLDATVIRLLDGTRVYLHAVLDNYSRKVLAWALEPQLCAGTTRSILLEARARLALETKVRVMTDGGSENLVIGSDADLGAIAEHVIAQVHVHFSNSMIEALWSALRHRWLYLHSLDTIETVRRLVAEYVEEHNAVIPRVELGGRTPDEAYRALELDLGSRLAASREDARRARVAVNRAVTCAACVTSPPPAQVVP